MNESQADTLRELYNACGKRLQVGPISGWKHPRLGKPDIEVMSDTRIRVGLKVDGSVADIDLGSYLQSSPPYGNSSPENRFRLATLVLRFPGGNFSEVCSNAGGSKDQFENGWMP
jgi:hypothetical protein